MCATLERYRSNKNTKTNTQIHSVFVKIKTANNTFEIRTCENNT